MKEIDSTIRFVYYRIWNDLQINSCHMFMFYLNRDNWSFMLLFYIKFINIWIILADELRYFFKYLK